MHGGSGCTECAAHHIARLSRSLRGEGAYPYAKGAHAGCPVATSSRKFAANSALQRSHFSGKRDPTICGEREWGSFAEAINALWFDKVTA
jgi:hypothetical protein